MSKNRSNNLFSSQFIKSIKLSLNSILDKDDYTTCVSAETVATHKLIAKKYSVKNTARLKLLVMTAIVAGQVHGFDSRKGRDGGIFRVKIKAKSRPRKVAEVIEYVNEVTRDVDLAISA